MCSDVATVQSVFEGAVVRSWGIFNFFLNNGTDFAFFFGGWGSSKNMSEAREENEEDDSEGFFRFAGLSSLSSSSKDEDVEQEMIDSVERVTVVWTESIFVSFLLSSTIEEYSVLGAGFEWT